MRLSATLVIILSLSSPANSQADDTTYLFFAGFHVHYGFIIPHAKEIKSFSGTNPAGIGIDIARFNRSYRSWKVFNRYLISGIQSAYFNFRNPQVLGSAIMITAFAEPVLYSGRNVLFSVRGGAGFSYHNKRYDPVENPENKFFSTRIGFPLYLNARLNYKISDNIFLTVSGYYNHISNGGIRQPNYGMNFPTLSAGVQYYPEKFTDLSKSYFPKANVRNTGLAVRIQALSGYKVVDRTADYPEKGFLAYGFHVRASKQLRSFYALDAGTEIILDGSVREDIRRQNRDIDYKRLAVTGGQEFLLGNVVFAQHIGLYVYAPYKPRDIIYQKYELLYNINQILQAGVFLKAHAHVADLMGLSLSIKPRSREQGARKESTGHRAQSTGKERVSFNR